MRNKPLMMSAIAMLVALMGGVIAKQMGMSRILGECSNLAKLLGRDEGLGDLKVTPLSDSDKGKGLYISFTAPRPPADWEAGKEDWVLSQMEHMAIKAVLLKGLPAHYLILESSGLKLHVKSTQISAHFPELSSSPSDS
ncbi:MAG: hypothetical protein AB7F75_00515 [Planctomycetota bacterium]